MYYTLLLHHFNLPATISTCDLVFFSFKKTADALPSTETGRPLIRRASCARPTIFNLVMLAGLKKIVVNYLSLKLLKKM